MEAKQSGLKFGSDDDEPTQEEFDENYLPASFRNRTFVKIPEAVKRDPKKYFEYMTRYFKGEASQMYKQHN